MLGPVENALGEVLKRRRFSKQQIYMPLAMEVFHENPKPQGNREAWARELSRRVEDDPDLTAAALSTEVEAPSPKTLENWYQDIYLQLGATVRRDIGIYRWPESHLNGALPFEAAEIGHAMASSPVIGAPKGPLTVGQVRWAHLLRLTAPNMPVNANHPRGGDWFFNLSCVSRDLSQIDRQAAPSFFWRDASIEERISFREVVADAIAWAPWESEEARERYLSNSTMRLRGPLAINHGGPWGSPHYEGTTLFSFVAPRSYMTGVITDKRYKAAWQALANAEVLRGKEVKEGQHGDAAK